jgi:hypothetical protein
VLFNQRDSANELLTVSALDSEFPAFTPASTTLAGFVRPAHDIHGATSFRALDSESAARPDVTVAGTHFGVPDIHVSRLRRDVFRWEYAVGNQLDKRVTMAFLLVLRHWPCERHLCMHVAMTGKADHDEVVLLVAPALPLLVDVVNLQLGRAVPPANAAPSATFHHHFVD